MNAMRATPHAGFTLIEIMIGMAVGMMALLAVLTVFEASEGYKRTITGGGDAQTNGAIAISALQRDIRQAGHGVSALSQLGCTVLLRTGLTLTGMAPVILNHANIPAGDANTDTLLVGYGASVGATEGDRIITVSSNTYTINPPVSYSVGDAVLAGPLGTTNCSGTLTLGRVTGVAGSAITLGANLGAIPGNLLYNLGPQPRLRAYAVRGGNLTVCDFIDNDCSATADTGNVAIWRPIASNLVSLRAQYGRDTSATMDGIVDAYDQTNGTTACEWARIAAVRLAVVARSTQYEKDAITTDGSAATWAGQTNAPISLSGLTNTTHYRYRKFETTVPILNIVKPGVPAGC